MSRNKKKFSKTTVGRILGTVAGAINPALGKIISGAGSIEDAYEAISGSDLDPAQKVELQQAIFKAQAIEEQELTKRLEIDSKYEKTRMIRPRLAYWYTFLYALTLIADSIPDIPFQMSSSAVTALAALNGTIIAFYFGGRTLEKIKGV